MRISHFVVACLLVVGAAGAHGVQKPKPKPGLGAIGTNQMPGAICKFNEAYTLGKKTGSAWNLCITSAEYRATRVKTGKVSVYPKVDSKFLVVHFTIHNPLPKEQWYQTAIHFTAVNSTGKNSEGYQAYTAAAPNNIMDLRLKPGQKVACYTFIEVPAVGTVDKLIAFNSSENGTPVARYTMAGLIKKLEPPYADPADSTGTTALKMLKVGMGQPYQIGRFDVAVLKVEQIDGTGDPLEKLEGAKDVWVLVTYQFTNMYDEGGNQGAPLVFTLTDADGGTYSAGYSLRASSVQKLNDPRSNYGEPCTFRMSYRVPRGVKLGSVLLKENDSHEIRYDLGGFTTN